MTTHSAWIRNKEHEQQLAWRHDWHNQQQAWRAHLQLVRKSNPNRRERVEEDVLVVHGRWGNNQQGWDMNQTRWHTLFRRTKMLCNPWAKRVRCVPRLWKDCTALYVQSLWVYCLHCALLTMLRNQRVTRCREDLQVFWCNQSQPSDTTDWSPSCLGVADLHGCKLLLRLGQTRIDGILRVPWLFDLLVLHGAARQSVVWPHRLVARWQASSWWSSWCWRPRGGRSPCGCQYRPPLGPMLSSLFRTDCRVIASVALTESWSVFISSFTFPSTTTPEHALQSEQHGLLQEHPVHHQSLQERPVEKHRYQEPPCRENQQSGRNPRNTFSTGYEPEELATVSRITDPYQLYDAQKEFGKQDHQAPITEEVNLEKIGTHRLPDYQSNDSKISGTS